MSEYTIGEETAMTTTLQPTDKVGVQEAASGRYKYITGAGIAQANGVAPVTLSSTAVTLTQATHANAICIVTCTSPFIYTLPAASGTGDTYKFYISVAATGTASIIRRNNSSENFAGFVHTLTSASAMVYAYSCTATDNRISLNGGTTGGLAGDYFEITDMATNSWKVWATTLSTGTYATPFGHT